MLEEQENSIETLLQKAEHYGKSSIELLKLKTIYKTADIVSSLLSNLIVFLFFVMFLLFFSTGIALSIGDAIGRTYNGFFAVGGGYAAIGVLLYIFRQPWIKLPISNYIITKALK